MSTQKQDATIANLVKALEAAESTLRRINVKNEQAAEMSLAAMKEAGIDINSKWPGGLFEDIAEAAQGRASLCRQAIARRRADRQGRSQASAEGDEAGEAGDQTMTTILENASGVRIARGALEESK